MSAAAETVRAEHGLVALGGAVIGGDGVLAVGASGLRRRGGTEPVELLDRWHLGSDTKAMTATLAAILVEDGVITWETTVAEAFPAFAASIDPAYRDVTLVHLLTHRAGLTGNLPADDPDAWSRLWANEGPLPDQRLWLAERLLTRSPSVAPGTAYVYSNAGYIIAGAMSREPSRAGRLAGVLSGYSRHQMDERTAHVRRAELYRRALGHWVLLGGVVAAACGAAEERPREPAGEPSVASGPADPLVAAVEHLRGSCEPPPVAELPLPTGPTGQGLDVAVYTAHPDDEAMYGGGTVARLTDAGHGVALVVMSHGEGGRLLLPGADGVLEERRDLPRAQVAETRDAEMRTAAQVAGMELAYLYPASADADFRFTRSCIETLEHWDTHLPDGLRGTLTRLVSDLRTRRPAVVVTLDVRDDPQGSGHGHHRALGALVDAAARLAADGRVAPGQPHAVRELWTFAPAEVQADLTVPVDPEARLRILRAHVSQFRPEDLSGFGSRPEERFVLRWRASPTADEPPLLETFLDVHAGRERSAP